MQHIHQIEQKKQTFSKILEFYCLDSLQTEKAGIQKDLANPKIWNYQSEAVILNKKLAQVSDKIQKLTEFKAKLEDLQVAIDLQEEAESLKLVARLEELYHFFENLTFLTGKFDHKNTMVTIHAGAGGVDAQDFAAMLASMYQAFCKEQNWKVEIVDLSSGSEGGVKTITMKILGHNGYGFLKSEAGVHRLIRISPFNSGSTRETSFALVEIIPEGVFEEVQIPEIEDKDLRWDYFMSSGKGGQSVNTTYSAVRVVHIPTKLSATCQNQRNQIQNKHQALIYLKNKIATLQAKKMDAFKHEIRGEFHSPEWGNHIRTYILHPYKLAKDHRTGFETQEVNRVLENGDLMPFIVSNLKKEFRDKKK
jgi:peptide chain release factor 2